MCHFELAVGQFRVKQRENGYDCGSEFLSKTLEWDKLTEKYVINQLNGSSLCTVYPLHGERELFQNYTTKVDFFMANGGECPFSYKNASFSFDTDRIHVTEEMTNFFKKNPEYMGAFPREFLEKISENDTSGVTAARNFALILTFLMTSRVPEEYWENIVKKWSLELKEALMSVGKNLVIADGQKKPSDIVEE